MACVSVCVLGRVHKGSGKYSYVIALSSLILIN